jgi:putative ABC transport system ATP-binding protein
MFQDRSPRPPVPRKLAVSDNAILHTHQLAKTYRAGETEIRALREATLDVGAGQIAVLLGPSGSGKSTLLNILGGLDRATSGQAFFGDLEINALTDAALTGYRRDTVGFVFQFYNLMPSLTALENVALVTEIARDPMDPRDALALVGLAPRAGHFPAQLSGGEQQRVAIARAIAKRPQLLLCDEPTGALDSKTGVVVLEALATANRELGTTTMLITHNAVLGAMADLVITMHDGAIADLHANPERARPAALAW